MTVWSRFRHVVQAKTYFSNNQHRFTLCDAQHTAGCCFIVSAAASQVAGSIPGLEPFCGEFACSQWVRVGSLEVLQLPPTVQNHSVRSTGDSKVSVGVNGLSLLSL